MFKKRKEAIAKEFNDTHAREEKQFESAIQKADQMTDPAEKVLALRDIAKQVRAQIRREDNAIDKKMDGKLDKSGLASLGSGAAAGAAVGIFGGPIGPPVGAVVGAAVAITGVIIGATHAGNAAKKLKALSASHKKHLEGQINRAYALADETVENNVEAISQSPLFEQVKDLPGMAPKFAKLAGKHILDAKAAAEAGAAEKPSLLKKRRNPGFRDITDGSGPK
jgi:hypothetical protein